MEVDNNGNLLKELPEEIVEMVLRHLDPDARLEAVLVCQAFYEHICRLEKDSRALMINYKLLDDNIFNSMMSSKRRISQITVIDEYSKVEFKKIIAVVTKFKRDTKTLNVNGFSQFTRENYYELLNAASEVENLSMMETGRFKVGPRRFVPLNKFNKLKRISLFGCSKINIVLDEVLDHSLEKLSIRGSTKGLTDQNLQAFLNRQRRIVQFNVPIGHAINLEYHVLKELTFMETENPRQREIMIQILKTQPMLRLLETRKVTSEEFSQICEMRNLEKLFVHIKNVAAESIGALRNLQKVVELGLTDYSGYPSDSKLLFLSQIQLPALQKLSLRLSIDMEPEILAALGQNFPNIQHFEVFIKSDSLAVIIDEFAALKTLTVYVSSDDHQTRPNQHNLTLEELKIQTFGSHSQESICFSINACQNLKRIELSSSDLPDDLILEIIQQHPHLTHFSADVFKTNHVRYESESEFSWMEEVLDIFRKSHHFIYMELKGSYFSNQKLIQKLLSEHFDNFKVKVSCLAVGQDPYIVTIAKNSSINDPYKNFGETP